MKIAALSWVAARRARGAFAGALLLLSIYSFNAFGEARAQYAPNAPNSQNATQPSQSSAPSQNARETVAKEKSVVPENAANSVAKFFAANSRLGDPLSIESLLAVSRSPSDRRDRLVAYWSLSGKLALVNLASVYQSYAIQCASKCQGTKADELKKKAELRIDSAGKSFFQAQCDFDRSFSTVNGRARAQKRLSASEATKGFVTERGQILYIPSVLPTSAYYETRYEAIARQRGASRDAGWLSFTIPFQYESVQARAVQLDLAFAQLGRQFQGAPSETDLLAALERYYETAEAFIVGVVQYNQTIAGYVAETVPYYTRGDELLRALNQDPEKNAGDLNQNAQGQQNPQNGSRPNVDQNAQPPRRDLSQRNALVLPGLFADINAFSREGARADAYRGFRQTYALILPGLLEDAVLASEDPVAVPTSQANSNNGANAIRSTSYMEAAPLDAPLAPEPLRPLGEFPTTDSVPLAAPLDNSTAPVQSLAGNVPSPVDNSTIPAGNVPSPVDNSAIPAGNVPIPGVDPATPAGNVPSPVENGAPVGAPQQVNFVPTSTSSSSGDEAKEESTEPTESASVENGTASDDKPAESTDKPTESSDKPVESGDKPAESTDKPAESSDKPDENKVVEADPVGANASEEALIMKPIVIFLTGYEQDDVASSLPNKEGSAIFVPERRAESELIVRVISDRAQI